MFARPFTAHLARMKMEDHGHSPRNVKTVMKWPETVDVGPFKVGFALISHSIPESSAWSLIRLMVAFCIRAILKSTRIQVLVNPLTAICLGISQKTGSRHWCATARTYFPCTPAIRGNVKSVHCRIDCRGTCDGCCDHICQQRGASAYLG